jgi:prophage maintenance system killer protein
MTESEIKIYQTVDGQTKIDVKFDNETVWLSQKQMAQLFEKDSDTIGLHLRNIYQSGELEELSTTEESSVVQQEGKRQIKRKIKLYNLDAIISVGYRVNSKRGIQFRIWANKLIKEYLLKGFVIDNKRLIQQNNQLKELQTSVKILGDSMRFEELTNNESVGLLTIITKYAYALDVLDQYDYQRLEISNTSGKELYQLTYDEAMAQIKLVKKFHGNSNLFGREKDDSFKSSISTIYQTFDGIDLYPSIEEKAANLLYLITKNHSFSDGNKRIAAFLFLYFLERNGLLFDEKGNKRIADNTLVALTLMIAVSKPDEKDIMTKVIVNLINKNN